MGHFPFLLIKLKFQWAILSKFNIVILLVNGPFFCSMCRQDQLYTLHDFNMCSQYTHIKGSDINSPHLVLGQLAWYKWINDESNPHPHPLNRGSCGSCKNLKSLKIILAHWTLPCLVHYSVSCILCSCVHELVSVHVSINYRGVS